MKKFLVVFMVMLFTAACGNNISNEKSAVQKQDIKAATQSTDDLVQFEKTPEELRTAVERTLEAADAKLDAIAAQKSWKLNFENVFIKLANVFTPVSDLASRVNLYKETSTSKQMREEAEKQIEIIESWSIATDYREDIAQILKAFNRRFPNIRESRSDLSEEDFRLAEETLRDFNRNGMNLPKETREKIQDLKSKLVTLGIKFDANIRDIRSDVELTEAELKGVPNIEDLKTPEGKYIVDTRISGAYRLIAENSPLEETRKKVEIASNARAMKENAPILEEMVGIRDQLAKLLGYKSWSDYQTEPRMAKNSKTVVEFLTNFSQKLDPKWKQELLEYQKLKAKDLGIAVDPNLSDDELRATLPQLKFWDWRYYMNQFMKGKYNVDKQALRVFFEMSAVQKGVFEIYQEIFGIKIKEIEAPYKWVEDLKLYQINDGLSGEVLGYFYLDLYPREGKYNHFAMFSIRDGRVSANGKRVNPVAALVCNFPKPTPDKPSLLPHSDVETFFHEFGHALHHILTTSKYAALSGTNVPRDFVEAPSQMLEAWAWDKTVLDRFAHDYRDPSKKLDADVIEKMKLSKVATAATVYRRQISLGLTDMGLHAEGEKKDSAVVTAKAWSENFIALPEGTNFSAAWGHMNGYDAGYYGYAWADSLGEDMLSVFGKAPKGLMDTRVGMKLRNEIYAKGNSRDVSESVEIFLGRKPNLDAFMRSVGIGSRAEKD